MNEQDKNKKSESFDLMQDTQYLLRGLEETESDSFALADILAEFGSQKKTVPHHTTATEKPPVTENPHPKIIAFPAAALPAEEPTRVLPKELSEELSEPVPKPPQDTAVPPRAATSPRQTTLPDLPGFGSIKGMEDVVASTVDAVKVEKERDRESVRRRMEKRRKKEARKRHEPRTHAPLPETVTESSPKDLAAFHKRHYLACRLRLVFAGIVLALLWLPWLLTECGVTIPFFSDGADNAAVYTLVFQAMLCVIAAPLFRAVSEEWHRHSCTFYTYTAAANLVTLLDEITLLLLPGRSAAAPLGGVAGCALVFSLWGLKNYHRGMWETLRIAAMGRPTCVVDCCDAGIAKGLGNNEGFVTRTEMESTASQWQRLLLPILMAASLIFALLASVGQQRGQDFLRCWSLILCASCALAAPLTYCVPFGRIARRLSRSGAAVAGQYGAAALAASPRLVVTDTDLFPRTTVSLHGIKLYCEERRHAIAYAATLAVQGGGCLARVLETLCQQEHIPYEPLDHFHVHDGNGLGGMIHGETVLLGSPQFMRHKAIHLPSKIPSRTAICLAVDGELTAIFDLKYSVHPAAETAMRALSRNGLSLLLASRDANVTPKLLKQLFRTDGKAHCPETTEQLSLSDPLREGGAPNGILYREGLLPYVELVALSRRLCQIVRIGNFLCILGSISGALLSFYLVFVGSSTVLTPFLLMTYLLLWIAPMLPLLVGVDRI